LNTKFLPIMKVQLSGCRRNKILIKQPFNPQEASKEELPGPFDNLIYNVHWNIGLQPIGIYVKKRAWCQIMNSE